MRCKHLIVVGYTMKLLLLMVVSWKVARAPQWHHQELRASDGVWEECG